jgi:acetyl-CoA/propionyl-CoA carboxylase carboxyl transferase subunit
VTLVDGRADARPAPAGSSPAPAPLGRDPQARLEALFDPGTLRLLLPADDSGVLAGQGQVDGMNAVAFASDPRVQGGAMGTAGCLAIVAAYDHAIAIGAPVIGLWHSGGARLREGVESLHAVGLVFAVMTRASGQVPQISVVLGPAAGGAAYGPALTDLVILSGQGRIFVTGPDVVRSVTGEDVDMERLGGPEPHSRRSGVVHIVTSTDAEALGRARELAVLLGRQEPGSVGGRLADVDVAASLPASRRRAYDVHPVLGPCWTSRRSSCTRAGRRTSSPRSAAWAAGPSAWWPTTPSGWPAAWTRRVPRKPPVSSGCVMPSGCRWSS